MYKQGPGGHRLVFEHWESVVEETWSWGQKSEKGQAMAGEACCEGQGAHWTRRDDRMPEGGSGCGESRNFAPMNGPRT